METLEKIINRNKEGRKTLIQEMLSIGEAKNKKEALSLVLEREKIVSDWIEKDFDQENIPEFLYRFGLKGEYDTGNFIQKINQKAKTQFPTVLEKDKEINEFIDLLKLKGKYEIKFAQTPYNKFFLNLSQFKYNDELFNELKPLFGKIEQTPKRLATLVYGIKDNFPQIWFGFNQEEDVPFRVTQQINGFNQKCWDGVENYKETSRYDLSSKEEGGRYKITSDIERFMRVLGREIEFETSPNKDSTGSWTDHYFSDIGFAYEKNKDKKNLMFLEEGDLPKSEWMIYGKPSMSDILENKFQFDDSLVASVYGQEYLTKVSKNLEKSSEKIKEKAYEFRKDIELRKLFKQDYEVAKEKMPDVFNILQKYGEEQIGNCDADVKNGLFTYIDGRSEWGSGGGIARFSQVKLWYNGKEYEKEFNYRDRWSGTNDRYEYDFKSTKIKSIKSINDENIKVLVSAIPSQKRYSSKDIEFIIKKES